MIYKTVRWLCCLVFLPLVGIATEIICQSKVDPEGHLGFQFSDQGLELSSCQTKQQICNSVDFQHLENHTFQTSGSFIFNGSRSETLVFDGMFENLIVKTDYALSRSGDPIKSKNIQSQFICKIANSV